MPRLALVMKGVKNEDVFFHKILWVYSMSLKENGKHIRPDHIYILDGVLPFNHFQEFHFDNKMSWVMNKGSFFWLESHQGFLNIKTLEMLLLFYFPAEPEEDGDLFVGQRIWGEKIDEKSCHGTPSTPKDPDVSILKGFYVYTPIFLFWLVVSTPLKNTSQIGNLPQIGVKIKKNETTT